MCFQFFFLFFSDEMPGEACDGTITMGDQFKAVSKMMGSPGYENNTYGVGVNCPITFIAKTNQKFFIRITEFNLEESTKCTKDSLALYDGPMRNNDFVFSTTNGGICGPTKSLPNYYYTATNEVTVKFISDGENEGQEINNEGRPYQGFELLLTPYIEKIENNVSKYTLPVISWLLPR